MADDIVFLIDVDNTLLDNDRVQHDLRAYLEQQFGVEGRDRYWDIYTARFAELGYADYLGAVQQFRLVGCGGWPGADLCAQGDHAGGD
jgi:hypothetical protein